MSTRKHKQNTRKTFLDRLSSKSSCFFTNGCINHGLLQSSSPPKYASSSRCRHINSYQLQIINCLGIRNYPTLEYILSSYKYNINKVSFSYETSRWFHKTTIHSITLTHYETLAYFRLWSIQFFFLWIGAEGAFKANIQLNRKFCRRNAINALWTSRIRIEMSKSNNMRSEENSSKDWTWIFLKK